MNSSLLEKIEDVDKGILATILSTEGHTYKKKGERALFVLDDPFPVYGNFGSLCVEQEIVLRAGEAFAEKVSKVITIDTSETTDIHLGYGTYCGGKMTILLEPITDKSKAAYRDAKQHLEAGRPFYLIHHQRSGDVVVSSTDQPGDEVVSEFIQPLTNLVLFGATPLAQRVVTILEEMDFNIHVIDWRSDYTDRFVGRTSIVDNDGPYPFDESAMVLILSHSFERDKETLRQALVNRCPYIGLLSSKIRRDQLYEDLGNDGISAADLARISSPVGVDIDGRSDPEIAISIAAELVRFKNR